MTTSGQRRVGRWRQSGINSSANCPDGSLTYNRILVVHDDRYRGSTASSNDDLRVNPEFFQGLKQNDLVTISDVDRQNDNQLQIRITKMKPVKGNIQISIRKSIADLFELKNRGQVLVRVVPNSEAIMLDFVQLSFSEQYISRGDMWRFKQQVVGSCLYSNQSTTAMGIVARADELLVNGKAVMCGLITEATKFVYRSRSAKITWLIQLSQEMWHYGDDGQLYEENVVTGLFKFVFKEWQRLSVNHKLTIVLFGRTYFVPDDQHFTSWGKKTVVQPETLLADVSNVFQTDEQQRLYQDFYKLVIECETRRDWPSLRSLLMREINRFSQDLRWGTRDIATGLKGIPSSATDGNMLEAINLAINNYDRHFIDRDLYHTGQAVVVVTAGTGVWKVDKSLVELTKERMVDNGVGCDILSMVRPPLHAVPLFIFKQPDRNQTYLIADDWLDMKFWASANDLSWDVSQDEPGSRNRFVPIPLCRMFPSGIPPPQPSAEQVVVPITPFSSDCTEFVPSFYESYDQGVFSFAGSSRVPAFSDVLAPFPGLHQSGSFPTLNPQIISKVGVANSSASNSLERSESVFLPSPLVKTLSLSALQFNASKDNSISAGESPGDMIPRRWASPTSSPYSPASSMSMHKIRLSTSIENSDRTGRRQQTLFHVAPGQEANGRSILVESTSMDSLALPGSLNDCGNSSHIASSTQYQVFHATEQNPFSAHIPVIKIANNRRRWVHLFPKTDAPLTQLNMRSLCMPAILPLTTDYFPSPDELQNEFRNTVHTLSLIPNDHRYHDRAENLVSELITQRLTNDFQLMVSSSALLRSDEFSPSQQTVKFQLSLGRDHHQILLDRQADNIQVHRYFRHGNVSTDSQWDPQEQAAFPYRYFLWSDTSSSLVPTDGMIRANYDTPFNWNYADQLTAGHQDNMAGPSLKYRRIRFAIVPPLTMEEHVSHSQRLGNCLESLFGKSLADLGIGRRNRPILLGSFIPFDAGFVDGADRHQSFSVYYDTDIDPSACFHVEVRWMMATGVTISRWVTDQLKQSVKERSLSILQLPACHYVPTNRWFLPSVSCPFRAAALIPLVAPSLSILARTYLLRFRFVPDSFHKNVNLCSHMMNLLTCFFQFAYSVYSRFWHISNPIRTRWSAVDFSP
uniref:DEP domain-containing protein n=2 Tax=Spongospora subterranea TaxID=70186 RepID=A0A0H5QU24_9EUKA|eukprot:CRZ05513.1 hypothetical protein [Spongospora subterranea]